MSLFSALILTSAFFSYDCPSIEKRGYIIAPRLLETFSSDKIGNVYWLDGWVSGDLTKDSQTGEFRTMFFNQDKTSYISRLYLPDELAESWMTHTGGDFINVYRAKALVVVAKTGGIVLLKLCAFNNNGSLAFESDEFTAEK